MSVALVVLAPRHIPVCSDSLDRLPVPKIRLRGWTEKQIADDVMPRVLDEHVFDHYVMASDDIIVREHALWHVVDLLERGHDVATGWCQRSHTDWQANVTRSPLNGSHPTVEAYDFYEAREIIAKPDPVFRTWFTGMALTGMSRRMWHEYPFGCFTDPLAPNGYSSDFSLSFRLQADDVPILCHRDAFVYHWRHEWRHNNDPRDDTLLVGTIEPSIEVTT